MWLISIITSVFTLISAFTMNLMKLGKENINNKFVKNEFEGTRIKNYDDLNNLIDNIDEVLKNSIYGSVDIENNSDKEENIKIKENKFENNSSIDYENINAYILDGYLNILPNNTILRVSINKDQNNLVKLDLDEMAYNHSKDKDNTCGYLIGPQPISLGDIYGYYEYETVLINGVMVQYPNIFILDENCNLDDKSSLAFKTKDNLMEFSVSNYENSRNFDAKGLYNKETSNGNVTESECGDDWFYIYLERSGVAYYSFTVLDGDRVKKFNYSFPVQYKDMFKLFIEQSRKSFYVFNGFPDLKS